MSVLYGSGFVCSFLDTKDNIVYFQWGMLSPVLFIYYFTFFIIIWVIMHKRPLLVWQDVFIFLFFLFNLDHIITVDYLLTV